MTTPPNVSAPPPSQPISEDGKWQWNGAQWVPRTGPPPPSAPPVAPQKKGGKAKGCLAAFGVLSALVVGVIIIAAIANGGKSGDRSTGTPPKSGASGQAVAPSCTQPCAVVDNVTVAVSGLQYDASGGAFSQPEAGNVYVTMQVAFTNSGNSELNVNPANFVLQDSAGVKHTFNYTQSCPIFDPVNLTKGASIIKCMAFQATAGHPTGLTLVWTPMLLGGRDHNIKLN